MQMGGVASPQLPAKEGIFHFIQGEIEAIFSEFAQLHEQTVLGLVDERNLTRKQKNGTEDTNIRKEEKMQAHQGQNMHIFSKT